jgi:hypothetical protein
MLKSHLSRQNGMKKRWADDDVRSGDLEGHLVRTFVVR